LYKENSLGLRETESYVVSLLHYNFIGVIPLNTSCPSYVTPVRQQVGLPPSARYLCMLAQSSCPPPTHDSHNPSGSGGSGSAALQCIPDENHLRCHHPVRISILSHCHYLCPRSPPSPAHTILVLSPVPPLPLHPVTLYDFDTDENQCVRVRYSSTSSSCLEIWFMVLLA
jgi:hypothetical protein